MFEITVPKEFKQANGKAFRQLKLDADGKPIQVVMDGKPLTMNGQSQYDTETAGYIDMLTVFLNNIFEVVQIKAKDDKEIKPLKLEDSSHATDVFRALHIAGETVELEKATKEWLQAILEKFGVDVYGVNASVVIDPIKAAQEIPPNRAERKRE